MLEKGKMTITIFHSPGDMNVSPTNKSKHKYINLQYERKPTNSHLRSRKRKQMFSIFA